MDHRSRSKNSLAQRMALIRQEANFDTDQTFIRDGVPLFTFVKHEALDANGRSLPNDGSCFPGARQKREQEKQHNSSAFVMRGQVDDAGVVSSSEGEEDINYDDDAEEPTAKVHTHVFDVNLVTRYPDEADDIFLHWGMSRKQKGAWGSPDPKFHPLGTQNWGDGLACQTVFQRDQENPSIRTINIKIKWVAEVDEPVTSISFVLTEKGKNVWHSPGGKDQVIAFCPNPEPEVTKIDGAPRGKIGEAISSIIDVEVHKSSWTLMHRYYMCKDLISSDKVDSQNTDNVVYFYIWLRYSFTKQLDWQRRYNTKPRELQGAQIALTNEICEQYKYNCRESKEDKFLTAADIFRSMIGFIGKGSGNGQQVRDEILHIMHRHAIPETQGHFYEQWHQKLHNNTTPDDIPICEALLAFLKSNNKAEYWRVLGEHGITRERLASYERKITEEPWYKPEAIGSFQHYLHILKQMHSSDDLNQLIDEARRHVGGDTHGLMNDLQQNYKDADVLRQMERASNLRGNLVHNHYDHSNTGKLKDIMFLDACLEAYVRKLSEGIMHIDIGFEAYIREVSIILHNLRLSYQWSEIKYCRDDWNVIVQTLAKNLNEDNARKVKSVIDRLKSMLGEINEVYDEVMQSKAEMMGRAFKAQDYAVNLFSEEVLRGTLFFSLSMILKKIDPHVRKCAHLGDWLIISKGRSHGSRGYVEKVPKLYDVMHKTYENRTILLIDKVTGEEEVPTNVQAIVLLNSSDYPDVLAHVSVRARNLKVLLAVNFSEQECQSLLGMVGKHVVMNVKNHIVEWSQLNPNQPIARRASSHLILQEARDTAEQLEPPKMFKKSLMFMDEFSSKHSGAKSNNLKNLRGKLDKNIKLPESASIPFQMCEYSLSLEPNVQKKLESLTSKVTTIKSVKKMNKMLYQCKDLMMGLKFHPQDTHHAFLKEQLIKFGIQATQFDHAWKAIKRVWASKFNERAFLATQKLGVKIDQIYMAVLVQRIVTAEYAYVIHTTNPTNQKDEEVYAEACIGLGEALVSDMPGQGMGFSYDKNTKQVKIGHYPNKPLGITAQGYIFRSDSNSEDLPGFAGAGLFDSYPMNEEKRFRINYNQEKLLLDDTFKTDFMKTIGYIGHHIERIYDDDPQDIEGAYVGGEYYVVQTRPQV